MPGRRLACLALAIAVLASGCGGGGAATEQDLEHSIVAARDRVDFALAQITQAQSKEDLLERMDDAADRIDSAAGGLEDDGAPDDYRMELGNLVDALHQLAFDVRATADQIRQPGFGELLTGTRGLSFESWDRVNRTLASLRRKGIEVAPLERH